MIFNPHFETMPRDQLRKLQDVRLQKVVTRLFENVPFYTEKFEELGINPQNIKGIDDLAGLPFTVKSDLRENYPFGLSTIPIEKVARIHCSSGTTGKPTVVTYSAYDLELMAEVNARSLAAAGAIPGMVLHNAYGYGLFTGGLGLHAGAEKLGMAVIPVSGGMTDRQLMIMQDFKPEVISCTPSYAQRLAEEVHHRGIDLATLQLKFGILGAEPWTEAIRSHVESGLNIQATNIYGLSEIIGPGVSQEDVEEKGSGSIIWEDHFYPEIVDKESGEVLGEGKVGVLVFTTLTKEAMPLLRYWTNDICSLHYDSLGKRNFIKMSPILGRADDMLIIRGVNFFPSQLEALLPEFPVFSSHYFLHLSRENQLDAVRLDIEMNPEQNSDVSDTDLARYFQKKIKENIGISIKVCIADAGSLPRSDGGKLNRVIDNRKI